jgi:hypothetical protein
MRDRERSMSSIVSAGVLDEVVPAACDDLHLDVGPAVVGPSGSRVAGKHRSVRCVDVDNHGWESAAGLEG